MTTRPAVCKQCELTREALGRPACALITCCSDPDRPSPTDYARQLHSPRGKCPHPDGDKWAGIPAEPMPAGARSTSTVSNETAVKNDVSLMVLMIQERARCCKGGGGLPRCAEHFTAADAPWGCHATLTDDGDRGSFDIRLLIKDRSWECPRGHFTALKAEAV